MAFALVVFLAGLPCPVLGSDEGAHHEGAPHGDADHGADAERLVAAMLGESPMVEDLRQLTDAIGGRPTGSAANEAAVAWALARFETAGVDVRAEPFEMPSSWREISAEATIRLAGHGTSEFSPRVRALQYSAGTPVGGVEAPLLDAGEGTEADFERLGEKARGVFLLVSTDLLLDVAGLFAEYVEFSQVESRALEAGAAGVVYVGSRPGNHLFRHNASRGPDNTLLLVVVERDGGERAARLLRAGNPLVMDLDLQIEAGGPYTSHNVIGEIPGTADPEEFVVVGAHLDSFGLGTGALDNGANVAMVIDVARQIRRLGLEPRRTLRFALWNGEEQGLFGSWAYVEQHEDELDRHVMASSFDIGTGRILGFMTNGRGEEIREVLDRSLAPVAGLGPFTHPDAPIYGTDHFDFLIQGVVGLVGNQASANYGPHYHARSDTFDKADLHQLELNSAITAALAWGFANDEVTWGRLGAEEIREMVETSLAEQMKSFGAWESWAEGRRGRQ